MLAALIKKRRISEKDTLYVFDCPAIAKQVRPGHFVEILVNENLDPFLRIPISIFDSDEKKTISLLIRTAGNGTKALTKLEAGAEVDMIGPLGNGFSIREDQKNCVLAGGGIGLAPLNYLARNLLKKGKKLSLFFSPARDSKILDSIEPGIMKQMDLFLAGNRKEIPERFRYLLERADVVYACGPNGMLEAIAAESNAGNVECQLSMEALMGCGFGICVGCNIAVYTDEGLTYQRVCIDGPVFSAKEVSFHERP